MTTVHLKDRKGKKGKSLFLKWHAGGDWHYDFLKMRLTGDKEADKIAMRKATQARINKEIELESLAEGTIPSYEKKIPFIKYFESKSNGSNWKTVLTHLKNFPGANIPLEKVNKKWANDFKVFLMERMGANSANCQYGVFKAALNRAVKDELIASNPAQKVDSITKTDVKIDYLDESEIIKMAATDCQGAEVKRAFLFSCFTGLRISDIELLKWENIEDGKIKFRQKKTGGFEYLELAEPAKKLLYRDQPQNVIDMPGNFIFKLESRIRVYRTLKEWARAAGIRKNIHFHVSRHSFAVLLLEKGASIYTVSKMLGHKKIATTERYLKLTSTKQHEAAQSLNGIKIKIG